MTLVAEETVLTLTITTYKYTHVETQMKEFKIYLWLMSNVVSADNIAATVKA